jgi:hypothetical protein
MPVLREHLPDHPNPAVATFRPDEYQDCNAAQPASTNYPPVRRRQMKNTTIQPHVPIGFDRGPGREHGETARRQGF